MEQPLYRYSDPTRLVVWWEAPVEPITAYTVLLDGREVARTTHTHITLSELEPQSSHTVTVLLPDGTVLGNAQVKLPGERPRLDVTAAPYNAVGDGKTMNTAALQQAIQDCPAGGTVYLPEGVYLTGALHLHSDMELYLEKGAVLQGSADPKDYLPRIHSRFEGTEMECYQSLIHIGSLDHTAGYTCRNVTICGEGEIRGGGYALAWATIESERERIKEFLAANADYIATCENENTLPGRVRGRLVSIHNSEHVRISGLTLADGASWNIHMVYSRDVVTDHCTICSQGIWNGDGWDPDSSEDCTIFACTFHTGDDSIAIKSGKNPEGNAIAHATRGVRIFDCRCMLGHGIAMGSEISGGLEDIKIWDCDLSRSRFGIEIKGTAKRGAFVRNIMVQDVVAPSVLAHAVKYNDDGIGAPEPPVFSDLTYRRVTLTGRGLADGEWRSCPAVELTGFDDGKHAVQNVRFEALRLTSSAPLHLTHCRDVVLDIAQSGELS